MSIEAKRISPIYYHIGTLVKDIEFAKKYYRDQFKVEFTETTATDYYIEYPHNPTLNGLKTIRSTYARTGSPYFEFTQAYDEPGVLSMAFTERLYYYGIWSDDLNGEMVTLKKKGIEIEAVLHLAYHPVTKEPYYNPLYAPIGAFFTKPDKYGLRTEYVSSGGRSAVEQWVNKGKEPVGLETH